MKVRASAPTKIILLGEHYVVYGAPALSVAVGKRRTVELEEIEGTECIKICNPIYKEDGVIYHNGRAEGHRFLNALAAVYKRVYENADLKNKAFKATLIGERIFKGMGASSAIFASLAKALYAFAGKEADDEEIFLCAQAGDEIDHGGAPSGVDARTVVHGGMIKFWREFNPNRFNYERVNVELPKDTAMLIVDTFKGKRCNTGDQVMMFAKHHNVYKKPAELSQDERDKICQPYYEIYKEAVKELNYNGNANKLGALMNENHKLLRDSGMSTRVIEDAIKIIFDGNGLGAKITGAGGEGGALIGYAWKKDIEDIANKLREKGFDSLMLKTTNLGVRLE